MPHVNFGKKDEPGFDLRISEDMIAIRTRSLRSVRAVEPVASPLSAAVSGAQLVTEFAGAGVEVYRILDFPAGESLDDRKRALRSSSDVRFAGSVLVDDGNEPVIYTENLFIKFRNDADVDDCREVLRAAGLTVKRELKYATNAFFVSAPEGIGTQIFDLALTLLDRADVDFCHPELVRRRARKAVFPQQWHLHATVVDGKAVNAHANVAAAHDITRGEGVTIAVIDDGIDTDHVEFSSDGKVLAPRDVTAGTSNPRPQWQDESHGTACAGVACADGNHGASGVAPRAKLMPIRLVSPLGSQQEADAFEWAADHGADVISCSWGPEDGKWFDAQHPLHQVSVAIPASTRLAIDYSTTAGRGGKGCVVLFAAGNGNESVENDGYASYERVVAVAACNDSGKRSVYSDFGDAIWCAFPSSDVGFPAAGHPAPLTPGIWTTDRSGAAGYNPGAGPPGTGPQRGDAAGDYCDNFGGTSSACPGAAGVVALMLSANPALKWHEVKSLLKRACDKIDPQGGKYDADGHSLLYGYGRLNARTAVQLAASQSRNTMTVSRVFDAPLPDLQTVEFPLEVAATTPVEALAVNVDIQHSYIGDLILTLIAPEGSGIPQIVLQSRESSAGQSLRRTFDAASTPELNAAQGKVCRGVWTLQVEDGSARDDGTLHSFALELTFPSRDQGHLARPSATPLAIHGERDSRSHNTAARGSRRGATRRMT